MSENLSPLMRQYYQIKNQHPETLLLFQVGDFYELFYEDAIKASKFLGITLTQRGLDSSGNPIPFCGVPVHVIQHYITKLVKGGYKIAICDQLEPARPKKIVERGVTQVLTPGTLTDLSLLDEKSASYLAICFPINNGFSLLFVELLTGQLFLTQLSGNLCDFNSINKFLEAELSRFMPDEIIIPDIKIAKSLISFMKSLAYVATLEKFEPSENIILEEVKNWVQNQFMVSNLKELDFNLHIYTFTLLFKYLKRNNERALSQLRNLFVYKTDDFLILDAGAQKNLELVKNLQDGTTKNTVFSVIDKAVTPMGSRAIKKWLLRPLVKIDLIEQRMNMVQYFLGNFNLRQQLREHLKNIGDFERTLGRISLRRALLHDYLLVLSLLTDLPKLKRLLFTENDNKSIDTIISKIGDFATLELLLHNALNQERNSYLIKTGYSQELDNLRELSETGTLAISELEKQEQQNTGILSLKIKFNGSSGYSIEITKPNLHLVPSYYIRVQSLANRERFTTPELKELEYNLVRAQNQIEEVEKEIFESVKLEVENYLGPLRRLSATLSNLDALLSLAEIAYSNNYVRPSFNHENKILIEDGRHPVVESYLQQKFISNSTLLSDEQSLWIITGPNMGGKSTYLRQVALISILAQVGSFVPAARAELPIIDKIFTRIGAADNVAEGKSTFLVEMEETALICSQATKNSLVILDEVGRGTSTYDGLAIAQAVIEYIYKNIKSRCLFATHYRELAILADQFPGIVCYYAANAKTSDGIVLLHKILPGIASGSFGLEVAKFAQLPTELVIRAQAILDEFHVGNGLIKSGLSNIDLDETRSQQYTDLLQKYNELSTYLNQKENELKELKNFREKITDFNCDNVTPKQALEFLWQLKG